MKRRMITIVTMIAILCLVTLSVFVGCRDYTNQNSGTADDEYPECLIGKVVYNIGRGLTPDLTFKKILTENGIEYVESDTPQEGKVALHYVDDGPSLVALLASGVAQYGIMGEPVVSNALGRDLGLELVMSIQDEWKQVTASDKDGFAQASIIISDNMAQDSETADLIVNLFGQSEEYAKNNPSDAASLLRTNGSTAVPANLDATTVERCNFSTKTAQSAKSDINAYLSALLELDNTLMSGALPDDDFYYTSTSDGVLTPESNTGKTIKVIVPDGSPAITISKLIKDYSTINGYQVEYQIVTPQTIATSVASAIKQGEYVVAVMPTNAAATLYNKGTSLQLAATNVWGLLYMLRTTK